MAFYLKTESASPKTHGRRFSCQPENAYRVSRVKDPGLRFYNPSIGRWANRDPIGESGGRSLYAFVRNDPAANIDRVGLSCVNVYTKRTGGALAGGWKRANSEDDVEISSSNSRNELGRFGPPDLFQITDKKNKCDIEITVQIYLNPDLPTSPTKGAHYYYLEHYQQSGTANLWAGNAWSSTPNVSPTRGSTLDHERGHARAFFEYTLPAFETAVQSYCGRTITQTDRTAIKAAFDNCRINAAKNSAQEANFSERLHYDVNGYKRLFPTLMNLFEYSHAEETTEFRTDEWIYE